MTRFGRGLHNHSSRHDVERTRLTQLRTDLLVKGLVSQDSIRFQHAFTTIAPRHAESDPEINPFETRPVLYNSCAAPSKVAEDVFGRIGKLIRLPAREDGDDGPLRFGTIEQQPSKTSYLHVQPGWIGH